MTERMFRASRIAVRIVAAITLADLGIIIFSDRYFPGFSHALANSKAGLILLFWTMGASLLLLLYVVFQAWWMRKNAFAFKALWIDAALAVACFLLLVGIAFYGWTHYSII